MTPTRTMVELTFIARKIEHWCPFGTPAEERVIDAEHRVLAFAPGAIFAFARWTVTAYGTTVARLDVLRATASGEPYVTVSFVRPGAEALLRLDGWPKVERAIQIIDAIRTSGIDPADAAPDYWFHVGNRLAAGLPPRPYSSARHAVWKLRKRLMP